MDLEVEAPCTFDEIGLFHAGVDASVIDVVDVKYAFVGASKEYKITRDWEDGLINKTPHTGDITRYNNEWHRNIDFQYEYLSSDLTHIGKQYATAFVNGSHVDVISGYEKFIEDPEDGVDRGPVVKALVSGGFSGAFRMQDKDDPGKEVYPAGTEVGFAIYSVSALNLGVGGGSSIDFLDYDGNPVQTVVLNGEALSLAVAGATEKKLWATSTVPFSGARLNMVDGAVNLDLGGTNLDYAMIRLAPEIPHNCKFNAHKDVYLLPEATQFQINWDKSVGNVEFEIVSVPDGVDISKTHVDSEGLVTGIVADDSKRGAYVIKATVTDPGHDNCTEQIVLHNNQLNDTGANYAVGGCGEPMFNDILNPVEFNLSDKIHETSGSLLTVDQLIDQNNILDEKLTNYAHYTAGVKLASDIMITGVKTADGKSFLELYPDLAENDMRFGYIVADNSNGLNVKALQFYQIRCYKNGKRLEELPRIIESSNFLTANAVGDTQHNMIKYSIVIPKGTDFDEFQLWTSGVADLDITDLDIYYPFTDIADSHCSNILGCDGRMIHENARVVPTRGGGVAVGSGIYNLGHFVDDDYSTYATVSGITVGQATIIRVDLGEIIQPTHQIGIITDNKTYAADVELGSWLTVRPYQSASLQAQLTSQHAPARAASSDESNASDDIKYTGDEFSNWNVLGGKVAGFGDKQASYISSYDPYDGIELQLNGVTEAMPDTHLYGICTRGDTDGDGIPDCVDPEYNLNIVFTGVETPAQEKVEDDLTVFVSNGIVTVKTSIGITRIMVFDLESELTGFIAGEGGHEFVFTLNPGMNIVRIEQPNGAIRTLKLLN